MHYVMVLGRQLISCLGKGLKGYTAGVIDNACHVCPRNTVRREDFETMQKLKTWLRIQLSSVFDVRELNERWGATLEENKIAYACGKSLRRNWARRKG